MSKTQVFAYNLKFNNDWLLIRALLKIYSITLNIKKESVYLRPKLVDVLAYYILLGYSDETKEIILKSLKIKRTNLNQINAELTKKKFLKVDPYNLRKKYISKDLESLRDYFLDSEKEKKLFLINFQKIEAEK